MKKTEVKGMFILAGVLFVIILIIRGCVCSGPEIAKTPAELHQERVEKQFNPWDGSHVVLTRAIKLSMNDPSSYEHVETRYREEPDNSLVVLTKFRGRNGFGGMVVNSVTAQVDLDGNILKILKQ